MMGAWGEAARDLIHQIGSCMHNNTGELSATAYSPETCSGRTARECGLHYGVQLGGLLVLQWGVLCIFGRARASPPSVTARARCLIGYCIFLNDATED